MYRADRIALGSEDPRPCLASPLERPLERRPLHLLIAELAREIPGIEEEDGRWPRMFETLRCSTIVGRGPPQLGRPSTKAPVYTTRSRTYCEPSDTPKQHRPSCVLCYVIPYVYLQGLTLSAFAH